MRVVSIKLEQIVAKIEVTGPIAKLQTFLERCGSREIKKDPKPI
jgi:hypothetical protein